MACLDYSWWGKLLYDWQTLITGFLAVGGGVLAYGAGVKQANATLGGAAIQSQATGAQTAALEKQNAELRLGEQRRLAREALVAARMLYASMGIVASDIANASARFSGPPTGEIDGVTANQIREAVSRPHFAYLWERVGNLDRDEIVVAFLALEAAMDQIQAERGTTRIGPLKERLDNLSRSVEHLRDLASREIERATGILSANEDGLP
jgi:hypothetical protein